MASAHNAPVLVIGLGRFGSAVAAQLRLQNKEVLAIEKDPELVQKWSGVLTHVVSADATDIDTLHQLVRTISGPLWWVWAPPLRRPC